MAREVYTAKTRRAVRDTADPADAKSTGVTPRKKRAASTTAHKTAEKSAEKGVANEKGVAKKKTFSLRGEAPKRETPKKETPKKETLKKEILKTENIKKDAEKRAEKRSTKYAAARGAGAQERAARKADADEPRKRLRHADTKEGRAIRDRRRAVSRAADGRVTAIALLTLVFEVLGLLLAAVHGDGDTQAVQLMALIAPLGLLTSLLLPRLLPVDALIMALTNFLCGVGVVILYTVSPARGVRQAQFYALGLAAMLVVCLLISRMRRFRGLMLLAMALGIAALVLPLAFGEWNNGAKNWVELPVIGSFQPSELVKLSLVLVLAYFFSTHRTVLQMMPAILFAALCLVLLMLQRDLGTALIYYLTTVVLFYAACGNVPLTALGLCGGAGAAVLGYQMFAHVKVRVAMWRNPWSDPLDKGYQIIQALLAIGSGGLFGVGLGQGTPEKIPAYYNDFIFAVVCEQMGLVFGMVLLLIYVLLILRGMAVVSRSRRSFDLLLGCGVLAMLGIQTFMIVGGVIKMIPLTGVTMPFLSYGGSSLLSCMAMVGILQGIGVRAQENLEEDVLCVR